MNLIQREKIQLNTSFQRYFTVENKQQLENLFKAFFMPFAQNNNPEFTDKHDNDPLRLSCHACLVVGILLIISC